MTRLNKLIQRVDRVNKSERVREHKRSNQRIESYRRRKRTIEHLQKNKDRKYSRSEVEREYAKRGYVDKGLGNPRGSDKQFFKDQPDGTQDHARIYEKEKTIKVEEHTDLESPKQDPIGHLIVDVGEVTYKREIENKNENRTKEVTLKKK